MNSPYLLLLEGSGAHCSVAVSKGDEVMSLRETKKPFSHSEAITLLIGDALRDAGLSLPDLSAVVISAGPGSYTSLRVTTSTAKGICYALAKPLVTLPSLLTLADGMRRQALPDAANCLLAPMIDARRKDVYLAWYTPDLEVIRKEELVTLDPAVLEFAVGKTVLVGGSGEEKALELLGAGAVRPTGVRASATHLASLGYRYFQQDLFANLASFAPRYITAPNITRPRKKL